MATDRDHDKNKHDPVEDGDEGKRQDHAYPEWPLSCSAAVGWGIAIRHNAHIGTMSTKKRNSKFAIARLARYP